MSNLNFNCVNFAIFVNFMHYLCTNGQYVEATSWCGVPGLPARGNITPYTDQYEDTERIMYSCQSGFTLQGGKWNKCNRGTWDAPKPPLCLENRAFRRPTQFTKVVQPYSSGLAVDGKTETCAASASDAGQRVWSVDLKKETLVEKVKITAESDSSSFKLLIGFKNQGNISVCGSIDITENYNTLENEIVCGVRGKDLVIIDRQRPLSDGFRLCEVEVYAKHEFRCGDPERPRNCDIANVSTHYEQRVKFRARAGYKITHQVTLVCLNGTWLGGALPECIAAIDFTTSYPPTTTILVDDKDKAKNSTEVGSNFIVGVAIGVTAASISTIVVIIIVVIVMKKYYKRNGNQCGSISEQGTIFLRANPPSSIGSCSPTTQPTYACPWDDPNQHTYEYISTDTLPPAPDLDLPPIPKDTDLNIDRAGYLSPRSSSTKHQWTNSRERAVRQALLNVPYRKNDNGSLPSNGRVNSFNELEVDAYGYPETDDSCRV